MTAVGAMRGAGGVDMDETKDKADASRALNLHFSKGNTKKQ